MSDYYKLDRPEKGLALIINNLHNEQKATRNDVSKLKAMFDKIGVQVIHYNIKHFLQYLPKKLGHFTAENL